MVPKMGSLEYRSASELASLIRSAELSSRELVEACLRRVEAVNPLLNAVVTQIPEAALEAAGRADENQARGAPLGPLHGLPIAHKDLVLTRGIRTTFGSKLLEDWVPDRDDLIVERLRDAGAILIGKTNTPEMGAGSQTYNEVFGETLNPWDRDKTCGGSSGGAAVALSAGMIPIADGSDMGGSLRNPASFCHVVGMRPSPGRVPMDSAPMGWDMLAVLGPMARNVEDTALLLSAMAGPDPRSPISLSTPGSRFCAPLERDVKGIRIAWSRDLGGLPVDSAVAQVLETGRAVLDSLGCVVEEAECDWEGADEAFRTLRAWGMAERLAGLSDEKRAQLKETLRWNLDIGLHCTGLDVSRAEVLRTNLYRRVVEFMRDYDFMLMPVSQVPPFPVKTRYPAEVAGVPMESYIAWMKSCYYVSVTGLPALSLPFGFSPDGLPVGVQIVGRPRDDFGVLQLAWAIENSLGISERRPSLDPAEPGVSRQS